MEKYKNTTVLRLLGFLGSVRFFDKFLQIFQFIIFFLLSFAYIFIILVFPVEHRIILHATRSFHWYTLIFEFSIQEILGRIFFTLFFLLVTPFYALTITIIVFVFVFHFHTFTLLYQLLLQNEVLVIVIYLYIFFRKRRRFFILLFAFFR